MPKRTPDIEPWERQEGETPRAFEAFAAYRDMGAERSIRKTSQKLAKNTTTIKEWSVKYNWVKRVAAYDTHLDKEARDRAAAEVKRMTNRHIRIAMQLQEKAITALQQLKPEDLPPKMLLAFIAKATQLERMNRLDEAGFNEAKDAQVEDDGFLAALNDTAREVASFEPDVPDNLDP